MIVGTSTKALQNQLSSEFPAMFDIRGRANYTCTEYHDCSEGRSHGCSETSEFCPASVARTKFLQAPESVTNYAYLLASTIHGEGFGNVDLLACDEGHSIPQELCDAVEIKIDHSRWEILYRHFGAYPEREFTLDKYVEWAQYLFPLTERYRDSLKNSSDKKLFGLANAFHSLIERVSRTPSDWIVDNSPRSETILAPLWPTEFAKQYLFPPSVRKVLLVSATIVPKTLALLGIGAHESMFLQQPHTFDPRRNPVYLVGPHNVKFENTDYENQIYVGKMDQIIGARMDRKGIIHTTSYDRSQLIYKYSAMKSLMLVPTAKELSAALEVFRKSTTGCVLVSPALTTGYDFPMDQCEYQILAKVPFIDTRGPIMNARDKSDPEYIPYLIAQTLVQTCGRAMRGPEDRCENFIMDAMANWFVRNGNARRKGYAHLFPKWFLSQLVKPDSIPRPPAPMLGRMA